MPELGNVETQKNAGYVDMSPRQARNRAKIEREEKELEALLNGTANEDEEESDGEGLEEPEVQAKGDTKQEEAKPKEEAQEDAGLTAEEKSFKKRYGDMRRHLAEKEKEYQAKIDELEQRIQGNPNGIRPPKTDEDIASWAAKYPDVADIVETIAAKKAKELFDKADKKFQEYDQVAYETERTKAENTIRKAHTDFDDLKASDKFHDWADEQPKWVRDALYENSDDPASVIRVIDLYKVDQGMTPSDYKRKAKDAVKTVTKGTRSTADVDSNEGSFTESQVKKMSMREYEKNEEAINAAIRNGKFVYDLSAGAR